MLNSGFSSHLTAKRILLGFRNSSSLPVLVETTSGAKCVVKWNGSGEGTLASVVDWICLHLARVVGIPVPTPRCITIGPTLDFDTPDDEIQDLITRSAGVNLGVDYIEDASPYDAVLAPSIEAALRKLIYLFDVLLCNIDRTDHNPNMVFSQGKLFCIDFSAAMFVKMLMSGVRYSESGLLPLIRRHPFYRQKSSNDILPVPSPEIVRGIVLSTPDEWLRDSNSEKEKLIVGIMEAFKDSRSILEHRLSLIDNLVPETTEERHARLQANRRAFEEKWGKL